MNRVGIVSFSETHRRSCSGVKSGDLLGQSCSEIHQSSKKFGASHSAVCTDGGNHFQHLMWRDAVSKRLRHATTIVQKQWFDCLEREDCLAFYAQNLFKVLKCLQNVTSKVTKFSIFNPVNNFKYKYALTFKYTRRTTIRQPSLHLSQRQSKISRQFICIFQHFSV